MQKYLFRFQDSIDCIRNGSTQKIFAYTFHKQIHQRRCQTSWIKKTSIREYVLFNKTQNINQTCLSEIK